jgi:hypothetical protein
MYVEDTHSQTVHHKPLLSKYAFILFPPEWREWRELRETRQARERFKQNKADMFDQVVLTLPVDENDSEYRGKMSEYHDDIIIATIDIRRLAVQCFIVLIIGGGLTYFWHKN